MKTTKMLTILVLALGIMVCSAKVSEAEPMGTAFTYQGRLIDANSAADGLYDFQFSLYDANTAGSQVGSDVNKPDVDLIDGYFTVELDFGSSVFDGNAVWLEIGVRSHDPCDVNAYTRLLPRQEVTPAPYALQTRGIFVDNALNVGIGTNAPDSESKLDVIATGLDGIGVIAEATHPTSDTTGIEAIVSSPNGAAGIFVNKVGGMLLLGEVGPEPSPTTVFSLDGDGDLWLSGNLSAFGDVDVNNGLYAQGDGYIGGTLNVGTLSATTINGLNVQGNGSISGTLNCYSDVAIAGNLNVTGSVSKGGGTFRIDHPLDPENKYLSHSFIESPDMMNVYNGNVVLDENGGALIKLPEYFEALNVDFRYQLTCIGGFAPVYISEEISHNHFKIAGGKAGMKVSWQVTGIRQDAFAKANPIAVEQAKSTEERGYYLYPAAYGFGEDKSITHLQNQRTGPVTQVARKAGKL